jgi:hypothetical protein
VEIFFTEKKDEKSRDFQLHMDHMLGHLIRATQSESTRSRYLSPDTKSGWGCFALNYGGPERVTQSGTGHFVSQAYRSDFAQIANAVTILLVRCRGYPAENAEFVVVPNSGMTWADAPFMGNKFKFVANLAKLSNASSLDDFPLLAEVCQMKDVDMLCPKQLYPPRGVRPVVYGQKAGGFCFGTFARVTDSDGDYFGTVLSSADENYTVLINEAGLLSTALHESVHSVTPALTTNSRVEVERLMKVFKEWFVRAGGVKPARKKMITEPPSPTLSDLDRSRSPPPEGEENMETNANED